MRLAAFDSAVNQGVGQTKTWLKEAGATFRRSCGCGSEVCRSRAPAEICQIRQGMGAAAEGPRRFRCNGGYRPSGTGQCRAGVLAGGPRDLGPGYGRGGWRRKTARGALRGAARRRRPVEARHEPGRSRTRAQTGLERPSRDSSASMGNCSTRRTRSGSWSTASPRASLWTITAIPNCCSGSPRTPAPSPSGRSKRDGRSRRQRHGSRPDRYRLRQERGQSSATPTPRSSSTATPSPSGR
jgi:hypothetical protein